MAMGFLSILLGEKGEEIEEAVDATIPLGEKDSFEDKNGKVSLRRRWLWVLFSIPLGHSIEDAIGGPLFDQSHHIEETIGRH